MLVGLIQWRHHKHFFQSQIKTRKVVAASSNPRTKLWGRGAPATEGHDVSLTPESNPLRFKHTQFFYFWILIRRALVLEFGSLMPQIWRIARGQNFSPNSLQFIDIFVYNVFQTFLKLVTNARVSKKGKNQKFCNLKIFITNFIKKQVIINRNWKKQTLLLFILLCRRCHDWLTIFSSAVILSNYSLNNSRAFYLELHISHASTKYKTCLHEQK